jgi:hypothetical protein
MARLRPAFPAALAALLALLGLPTAAGAGPLPRIAASVPAGVTASDVALALRGCGPADPLIILAPVTARIGGMDAPAEAGDAPRAAESRAGEPAPGPGRFYQRVLLEFGDLPDSGRERESLIDRQAALIVGRLGLDRPWVAGLVVEAASPLPPAGLLQFAVATLVVKARGARPGLQVAIALPPDAAALPIETSARIVAYVDSVVLTPRALATGGQEPGAASLAAGKPVMVRVGAGGGEKGPAAAFLDLLMTPGAGIAETVWLEAPGTPALRAACASVQVLARALGDGFEMTAPERAPAAVLVDGKPAATSVAFVAGRAADVGFLLRAGGTREAPRPMTLAAPPGQAPKVTCLDAADGRALETRSPGGQPGCLADAEYVLLVARAGTPGDRLFEAVNVTGRASMRVEEIIARWQASREAERQLLENYSVPCFLGLHFETTSLAATFDVALELRQFVDRSGVQDWVQTAFRVNGVKLRRGQEFPLPQLDPERVVTKPLELRIEEKYVYELLGTDTVDGRVCYLVGIKPTGAAETLYSGKVWIDGVEFRQVRLRLEQRDGKNNVASHVETQEFEQVRDPAGRAFTLVRSIRAEDAVNLAGRTVTVEKRYLFGEYTINAPDFASRLAAARASDDPMFRETEDGLRALRKKEGERVVAPDQGKRIWAMLGGVLYNGAYTVPIPLAGVSWVDFDWHKTGNQLSALFGGPMFVANLSRQVNEDFRWGVDLSLIALPNYYNQYSGDERLAGQEVKNFEQFVGGLVNWQATTALTLSAQADLFWDTYRATDDTDPAYRLPASGLTAAFYGEAKYVRRGFSGLATVEQSYRLGWRDFGYESQPEPTSARYTKYTFEASQHVYAGKLTRGGLSAAYFGGHDLDRFSRYTPNFLQRPQIKGIPTGVDTFDEITSLGAYYGFNVLDLAKLEGSYSHSWTRNRSEGPGVRQLDGLDLAVGMAGPFGTFIQGSVSYALTGNLARYTTRWGTYMLVFKPLRK